MVTDTRDERNEDCARSAPRLCGLMGVMILDGAALASRRLPHIAARSAAVRSRRGRAPALLLFAFEDDDARVAHVTGKQRACEAAGVNVTLIAATARLDTATAAGLLSSAIAGSQPDAVFVQVPLPRGIDEAHLMGEVPPQLDIDIMTPGRVAGYMTGAADEPPVTVTAALLLLGEHDIDIEGRRGVIVAQESDFALMFSEALRRHGVRMGALVDAADPDLERRLRDAQLVVAAAARPGAVSSAMLAPGCVAIDAGYFNPGGRGDIDISPGIHHLTALMPVPGGIGPMTVSALIERVVQMAEG